ncbi:MAG: iron-containing alcohol dehydrogenase [Thermoleophilia bacterium]|nr:iron-containing alcohol dehydrogenase [Thermoleophilia bacterium]
MIVRWGVGQLGPLLRELAVETPLLVTSERWRDADVPVALRFTNVRPHTPAASVQAAAVAAEASDGLVALGGGSAIDTAKAVSARTGLPVVSVPTTYSGAEWTTFFGTRDEQRGVKGGGSGARLAGIVYEPELTLDLPRDLTGGTALNALAHCAEALYTRTRAPGGDPHALRGAALIADSLPAVLENGHDLEARTRLLEGAMHAGAALAASFMGLAHAMAQALGGRYGLPHGALNAICLPVALRFNELAARAAIRRFGEALGEQDVAAATQRLARLAGYERLRDLGVPRDELDVVAAEVVERPAARANPRSATAAEVAELLRAAY